MHSISIFLLAFSLLVTIAIARPGKRPWFGHHHHNENTENEMSQGRQWSTYRLPNLIRLPRFLVETLGQPIPTFTAKKILNGKYLLISPAFVFKLNEVDNDTESTTTVIPESSTTDQPDSVESTTTVIPFFFKKRSFPLNDNEQFLFLDD